MKKTENNEELKKIEVELEDGTKVDGELLFSYEENGDTYILYELNDMVYGAKMREDNSLYAIEEDEWKIIENIYQMWIDEQDDEEDNEDEN